LNEADKWRQQILREVGKKVMEIQNAALGEHRLRDLNDEINKLIREKGHWEKQIRDLGGPDYAGSGPKTSEAIADGSEVEGASGKGQGYRYFGAAKTLPGVKELFQRQAPRTVRRTRHQMFKEINAAYYGFRDEEDGIVVKAEDEAEASVRREAILEYNEKEAEKKAVLETVKGDGTFVTRRLFHMFSPIVVRFFRLRPYGLDFVFLLRNSQRAFCRNGLLCGSFKNRRASRTLSRALMRLVCVGVMS
jgi:pre-mRNA-splicing factor ISY1